MEHDQLVAFIQTQRSHGVSDSEIKALLVGHNWPNTTIEEVLFMTPRPTPQGANPSEPAATMYSKDIRITEEHESKPGTINAISLLFFILGIFYAGSTLVLIGIYTALESRFGSVGIAFNLFKVYPSIACIPILFSLLSLIIFYIAFKVRDGSPFSFWLALSSIISIPIISVVSTILFMTPLFHSLAMMDIQVSLPSFSNGFNMDISTVFLYIPAVIIILISYKKFHFTQTALSKKAKITLAIICIIVVLPMMAYLSHKMLETEDTDFGYTAASRSTSYHIYKPRNSVFDLTNTTKFETGRELAGQTNAVSVGYDIPIKKLLQGEKPRILVVKQVQVPDSFDVQMFVKNTVSDPKNVKTEPWPGAKYQATVTVEKPGKNNSMNQILFVTSDNVLIDIIGPGYSVPQLLEFAKTLQ